MPVVDTDIEKIKSIDFFQGLTHRELIDVMDTGDYRNFESGEFLFFESDPATIMYVLIDGQIKLSQLTPEGKQVILSYATPGSAFGIIAVLGDMNYPVSAQALADSRVLCWGKSSMHELMIQIPNLSINGLAILSWKIREFQDRIRELSTERVERRIARALLRLGRQTGRLTVKGIVIDLPITRQDLGEMTGTTLYTVSRILSKWESMGLISSAREKITIKSPHKLVVVAEDYNNS